MRFIVGSICVLLGLFVVGGARPMERGTGSTSAASTSSNAASEFRQSAGSRSRVLSEQEVGALTHTFDQFSIYNVAQGKISNGQNAHGFHDEYRRPTNSICQGLFIKISLEAIGSNSEGHPIEWPTLHQYPELSSPSLSAMSYMQSTILLLLRQLNVISKQQTLACVHFNNLNYFHRVWGWVPKTYGFRATIRMYSMHDESLGYFEVSIGSAGGNTYPVGVLLNTKVKRYRVPKAFPREYKAQVVPDPAGTDVVKQCSDYLTAVFSEADEPDKQLVVVPIRQEPLSIMDEDRARTWCWSSSGDDKD
ncbi:hypothetical protein EV361DRAFT_867696 [Lentinula raphanica]|nr:hypothetical protein EV361DRAFT_867696 [Lentinula raphanica]